MCNFVSYFVFILDHDLLHSKTCFWVTEIGTPVSEESPLYEYAVFSKTIARTIIIFLTPKGGDYLREGDYSRGVIISNFAHWKSWDRALNLLFYYPRKLKNYHIKI